VIKKYRPLVKHFVNGDDTGFDLSRVKMEPGVERTVHLPILAPFTAARSTVPGRPERPSPPAAQRPKPPEPLQSTPVREQGQQQLAIRNFKYFHICLGGVSQITIDWWLSMFKRLTFTVSYFSG
jgi:hypothetical protein